MNPVIRGRYTAQTDQPFVLLLIGMRINQPWRVDKWWPVAQAMAPMLETLYRHPEKGFLGGYSTFFWPGVLMVQVWRSFDDLERFAHALAEPHLAAWRRFNQAIGSDGSVGIFHESYGVQAGEYECVYGNMPRFGLGSIFAHVPASGRLGSARERLKRSAIPATDAPLPSSTSVAGSITQSSNQIAGHSS